MTRPEFVNRIFLTDCENCPINIFCKLAPCKTCVETARLYYMMHKPKGGDFIWPERISEYRTNNL